MESTLECSTIVFRTVTRARDIGPDERPLANAFMLRPLPRDENGLSVDYNVDVPDGCAPDLDPKSKKGIFSLHVGRVRDDELDVVPDTETHANIVGLARPDEDPERAEQQAVALVAMCRTCWLKPKK